MPVDWFDAEDVADYLEADVIFCDFMVDLKNSNVTQFTDAYETFPWFTWATYCSVGDISDPDAIVPPYAFWKTEDFTGFNDPDAALAAGDGYDPSDAANWETDAFVTAWEAADMEGVIFMYAPYFSEWFADVACYDWSDVTADVFYSDYYFESGSIGCYEDRAYLCVAEAEECETTTPGTDEAIWEATTYGAATYDEEAILNMSLPVAECFDMPSEEGYPFMVGDLVCDIEYPDFIAWACVDEKWCSSIIPTLDDLLRVENTWELILDGQDAELSRTTVVPEVEADVGCATWANKFGSEDIGEENYWCDADRVWECLEDPTCDTLDSVDSDGAQILDDDGVPVTE